MPLTKDPVGLALAGLGAGSASGAAVVTAGMLLLRTIQVSGGPEQAVDLGFTVIWASLALGITAAVATGWMLTGALDDTWRRAVVGALSVFGTALLAGIGMPVDLLAGRVGLTAYLFAMLVAALYARSAALRAGRT